MDSILFEDIKAFLDAKYDKYACIDFIESDPIKIPHSFTKKEDIEISGFISASIAWGQRKTIVNNSFRFMRMMDNAPFDFIMNANESDYLRLERAVHRTFNGTDLIFFAKSLKNIYSKYGGLENLFIGYDDLKDALINFYKTFFEIDTPNRTKRHVSNVAAGSAAKRLNMFLRWMIRDDGRGVDFGLWKNISPAKLYIPLDVHSGRIARMLGLLKRNQNDWKSVEELTSVLRRLDPKDPVKYDFALFGLGVNEEF